MKKAAKLNRGKNIAKKLRGSVGETLSETLVALLIAALALVMLAGAVTASAVSMKRSRSRIDEYYTQGNKTAEMNDQNGTVSFTVTDTTDITEDKLGDQTVEDVPYYLFSAPGGMTVISYKKA